jgi:hypothetical protein
MPKDKKNVSKGGAWLIRDIPRDLMKRAKIAAAVESTSVKALILKALTEHLQDLEKKGLLPKGKWASMRKDEMAERIHQAAWISEEESAQLLGVSKRSIQTYRLKGFIIAYPLPSKTVPRYRYLRESWWRWCHVEQLRTRPDRI